MLKKMIGLVVVLSVLLARDNPFESEINSKNLQGGFNGIYDSYFKEIHVDLPTSARILKQITLTYQDVDGSIHSKVVGIDKSIDWHYPLKLSQHTLNQDAFEKRYQIQDFDFLMTNNTMILRSPYKILRSFVLVNPYRIVLDTQKGPLDIYQNRDLNQKFFSHIKVGTHKDYYRITLILDGKYRYLLEEKNGAYELKLK
ncbi:AMIN domain-containing protein [Helicobacter pylori]|uniref:AMIN domain-containing protein n=1 Tax=Helicobacter pylori TaxID=210 RepID=UPI001F0CE947|nr:AMIN domain-containing protein [Helicobacter pylori]MCH4614078.1 AMIN domain-containing protein [Helicobacter pylori]